jgi:hypothetical protein
MGQGNSTNWTTAAGQAQKTIMDSPAIGAGSSRLKFGLCSDDIRQTSAKGIFAAWEQERSLAVYLREFGIGKPPQPIQLILSSLSLSLPNS